MTSSTLFDAMGDLGKKIEAEEPISPKKLSQEDVELLYAMAFGLYEGGDYTGAKPLFRQLVVSKPLTQKHWVGLASTLQMEKNYEEALTAWSMAALMERNDPSPHFHAAECLFSMGQTDEARKALNEVKKRTEEKELLGKVSTLEEAWEIPSSLKMSAE